MKLFTENMNVSARNNNIVHLDAPIIPDESDMSSMTIIQTSNGSIMEDQMFLNTMTAQAISGIFVWSAVLITCYQVSLGHFTPVLDINITKPPSSKSLNHYITKYRCVIQP